MASFWFLCWFFPHTTLSFAVNHLFGLASIKNYFYYLPQISPLMFWSINIWKSGHQTCINYQSKSKQVLMCSVFSAWACLFWLPRGLLNLILGSPLSSGKAATELNSKVINYCYTLLQYFTGFLFVSKSLRTAYKMPIESLIPNQVLKT